MRGLIGFIVAVWLGAGVAEAETSLTLNADPIPIVEAQINGRPVRLEVDMRLPGGLMLSTRSAERLGVRRVPFVAVQVGLEGGGTTMRGRLARPRIVFAGEDARAFTAILPAPVSSGTDGVIGPGALPYDVVTIRLGPDQPDAREIVFNLADAKAWTPQSQAGGQNVRLSFDVTQAASVFNRSAAARYDATGAIHADGDLAERPVIIGLRTMMQPVTTGLMVEGLSLGPAYARTDAPLLGAEEEDVIVVEADSERVAQPTIMLGREALSHCASISVDNRSKRMILRCA